LLTEIFLIGAAFTAGLIDGIVGGGGLILLPALFSGLPDTPPAHVLGTNKGSSVFGLMSSAHSYARRVTLPWHLVLGGMAITFCLAWVGAQTVHLIPSTRVRLVLPIVLAGMLVYTMCNRSLGMTHAPRHLHGRGLATSALVLALLGFYDGFIGPGTGAVMMFVFARHHRFDFLHASAAAKFHNLASNAGALLVFGLAGEILWPLAASLAVASIAGAQIGARLAIARGIRFVRLFFLLLSGSLIAKTAWDAWRILQTTGF
jgi:uncharacterized membrane protein YfcA